MFEKRLISIDIGSKNIHVAEGICKNGKAVISKAFMVPASADSMVNGKPQDIEILRDTIKSALSENKVYSKKVVFTTQSSSVILRELILPYTKNLDLGEMVRFEMEQFTPSGSQEYIIDYTILQELSEGDLKKYRIRGAAMQKEMAKGFFQLAKELKLSPVALNVHPNSISKLFRNATEINGKKIDYEQTTAFIDFGYSSISINVFTGGIPEVYRLSGSGLRELYKAIINIKQIPAENINMNDFEELKSEFEDLAAGDNNLYQLLIRTSREQWLAEILRVFQYYNLKGDEKRIKKVYIYGGGSTLKGIAELFAGALDTEAEVIESCDNLKFAVSAKNVSLACYINAIGAIECLKGGNQ